MNKPLVKSAHFPNKRRLRHLNRVIKSLLRVKKQGDLWTKKMSKKDALTYAKAYERYLKQKEQILNEQTRSKVVR